MPKKQAEAAPADSNKIAEGELAVRLTNDIHGGIGDHKEGTVLRHLSPSAYNTLVQGGHGEALKAGEDASEAVDASAPPVTPTTSEDGAGTNAGGGASE